GRADKGETRQVGLGHLGRGDRAVEGADVAGDQGVTNAGVNVIGADRWVMHAARADIVVGDVDKCVAGNRVPGIGLVDGQSDAVLRRLTGAGVGARDGQIRADLDGGTAFAAADAAARTAGA